MDRFLQCACGKGTQPGMAVLPMQAPGVVPKVG